MPKREAPIGQQFHYLTVIKEVLKSSNSRERRFLCLCRCGNEKIISLNNLTPTGTKSCGCYQKERTKEVCTTHGLTDDPLYSVWTGMMARCYNTEASNYPLYGGRGIIVCKRWRTDPEEFIRWGINSGWQPGLELDRKDNDGNYKSTNCRWVTPTKNRRNKRNNRIVTYRGKRQSLAEAVENHAIAGLTYHTVKARLGLGWTIKRALETPVRST